MTPQVRFAHEGTPGDPAGGGSHPTDGPVPRQPADHPLHLQHCERRQDAGCLQVARADFAQPRKITDANPQQAEYAWGRRILFDYTNRDGVRLQGVGDRMTSAACSSRPEKCSISEPVLMSGRS